MSQSSKHYEPDADWQQFADKHGITARNLSLPITPLDYVSDREAQLINEGEWSTSHPLEQVGYTSRLGYVEVRDGHLCEIKIYRSSRASNEAKLPLLFVTHGGGWIQGTYTTEEAWLLWPLFSHHDLVVVSVNYRLAPENAFPTFVNDSWDVLGKTLQRSDDLSFDPAKVVLAGSSAGGGLAAVLSQKARDAQIPIAGVLLNVPVLCDPRHFPNDGYEYESYKECIGVPLLSSNEMHQVWKLVVPSEVNGKNPVASPLLGDLSFLPSHTIYVAGRDPVRDEALAYGEKLKKSGAQAEIRVYSGVPHNFAEYWELKATQKFWEDIRQDLKRMLD